MILAGTSMEAVRALRGNKLRSLLSTLGVGIGSACVVLVVTVSLSANTYITGLIESIGSNLVYAEFIPGEARSPLGDYMSLGDMEAIRASIPQVVNTGGSHEIPVSVAAGGTELAVSLVGVTAGFQEIRRLIVVRGRYFDEGDVESHSKVCLITEDLAQRVFGTDDPIGRTIRAGELIFTVIGVFRERGATFGEKEIQRDTLLVPFAMVKNYSGADFLLVMYAQADRAEDVPLVTRGVAEVLRSRHRSGLLYSVQNLTSLLDAARKISMVLSIVLLLVGFITLTIGGVNIMNIMLVTVKERTHEIGLRRAVGARREDIRSQFLMEAVMISGIGALAGILVGVVVPVIVQPLLPGTLTVRFAWLSVLIAFGVSSAVGIVFGYLPADIAAKLEPAEALRHE
ncbi:MAG: ABC transporter permease [Candidatus Acidiferrales bacterium]